MQNRMVDLFFRGVEYTPPGALYIALCTAVPSVADTGSSIPEVTGGNYARHGITTDSNTWYTTQGDISEISTGIQGSTGNINPVSWDAVSWTGTVTAVAICDASVDGNLLYYSSVTPTVVTAGAKVLFASNTLRFGFS
jgi:hypothetical protein